MTSTSTNQRTAHEVITYSGMPFLLLAFKNALLKHFGEFELFWGLTSHPFSLLGPAINLSLLQTPTFRFVWPHRELHTLSKQIFRPMRLIQGDNSVSLHSKFLPSTEKVVWLNIYIYIYIYIYNSQKYSLKIAAFIS